MSTTVNTKNYDWDATEFFKTLVRENALCESKNYNFARCSGLDGLEEFIASMQKITRAVIVSDISPGFTDLNNAPRTRRVKTVFLVCRHRVGDMTARNTAMAELREIFRQFMSRFLLEKNRIEQGILYFDPRVQFTEISPYFASGCACAYFQIAVNTQTDLRYNPDEWLI
ncbi:MAG: hypothetical protein J6W50_03260 [Bacteroidaceae bacterium]|nr:hypothetical protein [Muribaculaceae bacterium]MBP5731708.1 hypothetical protein [Bacteroidaceae bacterium]